MLPRSHAVITRCRAWRTVFARGVARFVGADCYVSTWTLGITGECRLLRGRVVPTSPRGSQTLASPEPRMADRGCRALPSARHAAGFPPIGASCAALPTYPGHPRLVSATDPCKRFSRCPLHLLWGRPRALSERRQQFPCGPTAVLRLPTSGHLLQPDRPSAAGNKKALRAMQFPRVEPRPLAG